MKEILAVGTYIQPDDELIINDLETLHVISDPLRLKLLTAIIDQPKPIKQIAAELEIDQIKLYYHFKMMEKHGLVKIVEERVISGIVEKVYRARARTLHVAEGLLSITGTSDESTDSMLTYVFNEAHSKLKKGIAEGSLVTDRTAPPQRRFIAERGSKRLPPEKARQFFSRLETLTDEFFSDREGQPTYGDWYDLVAAMYPVKVAGSK
jgi:DNA-binding transcriptional ArsR family regulator